MDLRSGYNLSLMPQYESASLHWPEPSWLICQPHFWLTFKSLTKLTLTLTRSSLMFESITNSWQSKPSALPLGIKRLSGQPQPQKLNWANWDPPWGREVSKSLYVLSKGMVTEESTELRAIVFCPCFTEIYTKLVGLVYQKSHLQLTLNRSNSMNINLWSLNSHGLPLSSNLGARKILQVASLAALLCTPIR